jgi:acyl-CoA thioesterase FadM
VRIRFDYEVIRLADGAASASGHSVHAALNQAGRPCRLPNRVLDMLDRPAGQPDGPTVYN